MQPFGSTDADQSVDNGKEMGEEMAGMGKELVGKEMGEENMHLDTDDDMVRQLFSFLSFLSYRLPFPSLYILSFIPILRGKALLTNLSFCSPSQKRHIESLESRLDTSKAEKAELARRLVATKDAAKKAIEASAKRFVSSHLPSSPKKFTTCCLVLPSHCIA